MNYQEHILKIRIKAPPEKNKANIALITFLAQFLHIPKTSITLIQGSASRMKTIRIDLEDPSKIDHILRSLS